MKWESASSSGRVLRDPEDLLAQQLALPHLQDHHDQLVLAGGKGDVVPVLLGELLTRCSTETSSMAATWSRSDAARSNSSASEAAFIFSRSSRSSSSLRPESSLRTPSTIFRYSSRVILPQQAPAQRPMW